MRRLKHLIASTILALCALSFASPAWAQIAWVKTLAPNSSKSTGTSLALTVPAAGVAAGNSIIVSVCHGPSDGDRIVH